MIIAIVTISILLLALLAFVFCNRAYIYCWMAHVPTPKYRVRREGNVKIVMPDGVKLASDIYKPARTTQPFPVLLLRTPYDKRNADHRYSQFAVLFASQGYIVIIQDVRGKFQSEGEFIPFANEEEDGLATLDWIAEQSWCDGNIGMFGFSYSATCAWSTTPRAKQTLKTIVPMFSGQNTYAAWFDRGVPFIKDILFWLTKYRGKKSHALTHSEIDKALQTLPLIDLDLKFGKEYATFREWMNHCQSDEYWDKISVVKRRYEMTLPVLFVGGWYDRFVNGTVQNFLWAQNESSSYGHRQSRLIVGPYAHEPTKIFPDIDYGEHAVFKNQLAGILRWFNRWLKGHASKEDQMQKAIEFFMTGRNEWIQSDTWPPPGTVPLNVFLDSRGNANTLNGDGVLRFDPAEKVQIDRFTYDPADLVPSVGGKMLYGDGTEGPYNQKKITKRKDVLVYTTQILKEELCIAGSTRLVIFVSTSAIDTDFYAALADVHPSGRAYYIQSGYMRLRYREALERAIFAEPGKIYRLDIPLGECAHAFLPKHRLMLLVTSSNFPNHARNLNTGGNNEKESHFIKAHQKVYHGGIYDSHLVLPKRTHP